MQVEDYFSNVKIGMTLIQRKRKTQCQPKIKIWNDI